MKAILSLSLVLLVVIWSVEGSKFRELYGDKIEKPGKTAQSKHKSIYGDLLENKNSHSASSVDVETPTTNHQQHEERVHHHFPPSPSSEVYEEPLSSQDVWIESIIIMAMFIFLAWLGVKQPFSMKKDSVKKIEKTTKEESDSLSESEEILDELIVKKEKEREQVEKEEDEVSDVADINEGKINLNKEDEKEKEGKAEKEKQGEEEKDEKEKKEEEKEKEEEEEWIVVDKPNNSLVKGSESESDSEKQLVLASASNTNDDENKETQLVLRKAKGNSDLSELTILMEALHIKVDPNSSLQDKLEILKVYQNQKKLQLKKESSENSLEIKRQNHELRKQKEKRRKEKELERQAYLVEEQKKQKLLEDDYHKMIILYLAAGIMFAIWVQVMKFSLFQHPFLSSSLSSSSSSSSFLSSIIPSFFSVPNSLSVIYNLTSWGNAIKFFYILFLIIFFGILWTFVPRIAPSIVLLIIYMHSYLSLFRAAGYFVGQWTFTYLSFALFGKLLPEHKTLKLSILYILNMAIAALLGNVIARGDPFNPYPQEFFSDVFVSKILSFVFETC